MRRIFRASPLLGCAAILVDFIGLGMIAPILPDIVSDVAVGYILSVQYIAVVCGQIAVGALADALGRRRVIVAIMTFDAVTFTATGFTKDVTALIVLRLLAGLAAPVALGISYVAAVSRDLPPAKAQFNFALVAISFNLGSLVGAATGGLLGSDLWLEANVVAGVVPAAVAVWALLSHDTPEEGGPPIAPPLAVTTPAAAASATTPGDVCSEDASTSVFAASAVAASAVVVSTTTADEGSSLEATADAGSSLEAKSAASTPKGGLRAVLRSAEFAGVLIAYTAQGYFQGSFFSLMPVILAGLSGSAPVIAGVIMAASVLQITSNLILVPRSLARFGALGHTALVNALGSLLLIAVTVLVGSVRRDAALGNPAWVFAFCAMYAIAYVPSATCLTVLNQLNTLYAQKHGAAVGTVTGIARSVFATVFGLAPTSSIALYRAVSVLPLILMATLSATAALYFAVMIVQRRPDPIPARTHGSKQPRPS